MAKELPYFKFEPNQWENGNIQICSREDKGLFMDLCSMYWSRVGDVPLKLAVQKLCGGNATAFDTLMREEIFKVIDDMICIDFLNEQLAEFENISNINSENARLGWEKRRKNATALNPQSGSNAKAMPEENSREENIYTQFFELFKNESGKKIRVLDDKAKRQLKARMKEGYTMDEIKTAIINCKNDPYHIENPKYLTPEFITRSDKLSKYINSTPNPKENAGAGDRNWK